MLLRLRNGLCDWKKLLFFFCDCESSAPGDVADMADPLYWEMLEPLYCFVGDPFPLAGSKLDNDVGAE